MSNPPSSEEAPVASTSSTPVIKIKFGVDPGLILNEPRKRPREVIYNAKAAAHAKQDVYEEPAYVLEKGGKLIQAIMDAREDEYTDGRLLSPDFLRLPSQEEYPDYYQIIKHPLALEDIEAKLKAGDYSNVAAVRAALEHCFWNAKKYNAKGSTIFEDAKYLHKLVKRTSDELVGKTENDSDDEGGPASKKAKKVLDIWGILRAKLERVINKKAADLSGRWLSTEFMDVPSKVDYPDYHRVIRKPRSFELILQKLKKKEYATPRDFVEDTDLIFSNAQQYNLDDSQISQDAEEMKILFHELVDDLVKNDVASGISSKPKIKIKVGGGSSNSLKIRLDKGGDSGSPAAANSLASAVAAITGVPVGARANPPPPQSQSQRSQPQPSPSQYINHNLPPPPPPQQQQQQPAPVALRQPSTTPLPSSNNNNNTSQQQQQQSLPQPLSLPNRASTPLTTPSVPLVKVRPGPPLLSTFVLRPIGGRSSLPGGKETVLTLKNERGVRAHAVSLPSSSETLDFSITIRDFVPPPLPPAPIVAPAPPSSSTAAAATTNGVASGSAPSFDDMNGHFNPYQTETGFDIDLSDPLTSLNPDSAAINLLASLAQIPSVPIPETDYKTYNVVLLFNGVVVVQGTEQGGGWSRNADADAEGFKRCPETRWKVDLGGVGAGGWRGGTGTGTVEVEVQWKEMEGGTGKVLGTGKEGYEVFVRRG